RTTAAQEGITGEIQAAVIGIHLLSCGAEQICIPDTCAADLRPVSGHFPESTVVAIHCIGNECRSVVTGGEGSGSIVLGEDSETGDEKHRHDSQWNAQVSEHEGHQP